jgi:hypothetical protein
MDILLLCLVLCNLVITIAVAGSLSRVISHLTEETEPRESKGDGLLDLPERQVSYKDTFMMNWDGVSPKPANFDGVPENEGG